MRFTALIQPIGDRFRGTVPDLPAVVVEADSSFEVEKLLPAAIEAHLDTLKTAPPNDIRSVTVTVYTRRFARLRRHRPVYSLADMKRIAGKLEALYGEHLPGDALTAVYVFRNELQAAIDKIEPPPKREYRQVRGFGMSVEVLPVVDGIGPHGAEKRLPVVFTDPQGVQVVNFSTRNLETQDPETQDPDASDPDSSKP